MPHRRAVIAAMSIGCTMCVGQSIAQPVFDLTLTNMLTESSSDVVTNGQQTLVDDSRSTTSNGYTLQAAATGITGPMGEQAASLSTHEVSIGAYRIACDFYATGAAFGVVDSESITGSRSVNEGEIRFTLSEDARVLWDYYSRCEGSGSAFFSGGSGLGQVGVEYVRQDGTPITTSRLNLSPSAGGVEEISGSPVLEIKGGTEVIVTYQMSAFAGVVFPEHHYSDTILSFSLIIVDETIQPVDSDDDGLPDAWEEEGIDVDGDGTIDIDLPGMVAQYGGPGVGGEIGASLRKTIFVELDAHTGVPVDQDAIDAVVQAFADAPVFYRDPATDEVIDQGIDLIVITDDTDLPNEEYDGTSWPQAFDDAKANFFGTAALRARPDWETVIKPAYASVFRYGIWGQAMFRLVDDGQGGTDKLYFTGKAERPGNDFYVAAGRLGEVTYASRPELLTDGLAGTFMHELGHNLNLRHGGHEHKNYKPNYLSVMNYTYQLPSRGTSVEGTDLSDAWFLDYAGTEPSVLNETMLREDQGYDGPSNRAMIFNVSPDGTDPSLLFVDADAPEIDWNFSGGPIETEPVSVDLTRFEGDTDELDTVLEARSDWDALWYHLSGADDFADGSHASADQIEELSEDEFELLQTYVVNDLRLPDACAADINADGVLDLGDVQAFVALFLASDLAADFNPDGVLDTGDITAFVVAFLEGC